MSAFRPDVVQVATAATSLLLFAETHDPSVPSVLTVHRAWAPDSMAPDRVAGRALRRATRIVCVAEHIRNGIAAAIPEVKDRCLVIPHGLPVPPRAPRPVSCHPPRALFLGRVVPGKGLDSLLSAWQLVVSRIPEACLTIAGDGALRSSMQARAREQGLAASVRFKGWIAPEQVGACLEESSLVVMPSLHEGFGLVAAEAAIWGRPVVAYRVGGLQEIVEHGRTGLLVDVGDVSSLAEAICSLLRDETATARMGGAARDRALSRFTWDRCLRQYDELLVKVEKHEQPVAES